MATQNPTKKASEEVELVSLNKFLSTIYLSPMHKYVAIKELSSEGDKTLEDWKLILKEKQII